MDFITLPDYKSDLLSFRKGTLTILTNKDLRSHSISILLPKCFSLSVHIHHYIIHPETIQNLLIHMIHRSKSW